jgi:hypothetical protein
VSGAAAGDGGGATPALPIWAMKRPFFANFRIWVSDPPTPPIQRLSR